MNPDGFPVFSTAFDSLAEDYSRAKAAERELVQARKVIWLLLRQIGEPVVIDQETLLSVPDDTRNCYVKDPAGFITVSAQ